MIVLDTHIWIWWVHGDSRLSQAHKALLEHHEETGLGVSAISCWEVAKLVEKGRLKLPRALDEWMRLALDYPGLTLLPLDPEIAIESTRLPSPFHNDPADQIIVATARIHQCPVVTVDKRISDYAHVQAAP
ncbi:MAG: type II toxin-antitoxin system VapC family toxin [Planctomycetota bacterium]